MIKIEANVEADVTDRNILDSALHAVDRMIRKIEPGTWTTYIFDSEDPYVKLDVNAPEPNGTITFELTIDPWQDRIVSAVLFIGQGLMSDFDEDRKSDALIFQGPKVIDLAKEIMEKARQSARAVSLAESSGPQGYLDFPEAAS